MALKRKNKNNSTVIHDKIKDYYIRAAQALNSNTPELGGRIILTEMPVKLYDIALDIDDNKNTEFYDQELRSLIQKVHKKLEEFSKSEFNDDDIPKGDINISSFEVKDRFPNKTF